MKAGLIHVADTADNFCYIGQEYSRSIKLLGWNRERLWLQAECNKSIYKNNNFLKTTQLR